MMNSSNLTLRKARALIRHRVRKRLAKYSGQDVLRTRFLVDRLDLAAEAYDYQTAAGPSGDTAQIEELIGFARDEFRDFILLEDKRNQVDLSGGRADIVCEACSRVYNYSTHSRCPSCGRPNLFRIAEDKLDAIAAQVELDEDDPIVRNALIDLQRSIIETSYSRIVSCFESFHRRLDGFVFVQRGEPVKELEWRNRFQNLGGTQERFAEEHDFDPYEGLRDTDLRVLSRVFNKRHIIDHNGGIIDPAYVRKTNGDEARIGSLVPQSKDEILRAVGLVRHIVKTARGKFLVET